MTYITEQDSANRDSRILMFEEMLMMGILYLEDSDWKHSQLHWIADSLEYA